MTAPSVSLPTSAIPTLPIGTNPTVPSHVPGTSAVPHLSGAEPSVDRRFTNGQATGVLTQQTCSGEDADPIVATCAEVVLTLDVDSDGEIEPGDQYSIAVNLLSTGQYIPVPPEASLWKGAVANPLPPLGIGTNCKAPPFADGDDPTQIRCARLLAWAGGVPIVQLAIPLPALPPVTAPSFGFFDGAVLDPLFPGGPGTTCGGAAATSAETTRCIQVAAAAPVPGASVKAALPVPEAPALSQEITYWQGPLADPNPTTGLGTTCSGDVAPGTPPEGLRCIKVRIIAADITLAAYAVNVPAVPGVPEAAHRFTDTAPAPDATSCPGAAVPPEANLEQVRCAEATIRLDLNVDGDVSDPGESVSVVHEVPGHSVARPKVILTFHDTPPAPEAEQCPGASFWPDETSLLLVRCVQAKLQIDQNLDGDYDDAGETTYRAFAVPRAPDVTPRFTNQSPDADDATCPGETIQASPATQGQIRCAEATVWFDANLNGQFDAGESNTVALAVPPHTLSPPQVAYRFTNAPPSEGDAACPGTALTPSVATVTLIRCAEVRVGVDQNLDGDVTDAGESTTLVQAIAQIPKAEYKFTSVPPAPGATQCSGTPMTPGPSNYQQIRCVEVTVRVDQNLNGAFEAGESTTIVNEVPPHTVVAPKASHKLTNQAPAPGATSCPGTSVSPTNAASARCIEITTQVDQNLDGDFADAGETTTFVNAIPRAPQAATKFTNTPPAPTDTACPGTPINPNAGNQAQIRCVEVRLSVDANLNGQFDADEETVAFHEVPAHTVVPPKASVKFTNQPPDSDQTPCPGSPLSALAALNIRCVEATIQVDQNLDGDFTDEGETTTTSFAVARPPEAAVRFTNVPPAPEATACTGTQVNPNANNYQQIRCAEATLRADQNLNGKFDAGETLVQVVHVPPHTVVAPAVAFKFTNTPPEAGATSCPGTTLNPGVNTLLLIRCAELTLKVDQNLDGDFTDAGETTTTASAVARPPQAELRFTNQPPAQTDMTCPGSTVAPSATTQQSIRCAEATVRVDANLNGAFDAGETTVLVEHVPPHAVVAPSLSYKATNTAPGEGATACPGTTVGPTGALNIRCVEVVLKVDQTQDGDFADPGETTPLVLAVARLPEQGLRFTNTAPAAGDATCPGTTLTPNQNTQSQIRCAEATARVDSNANGHFDGGETTTIVKEVPPHSVVPPQYAVRFTNMAPDADDATCPGTALAPRQNTALLIRCAELTLRVDQNQDGDVADTGETTTHLLLVPLAPSIAYRFTDTAPASDAETCPGIVKPPTAATAVKCVEITVKVDENANGQWDADETTVVLRAVPKAPQATHRLTNLAPSEPVTTSGCTGVVAAPAGAKCAEVTLRFDLNADGDQTDEGETTVLGIKLRD